MAEALDETSTWFARVEREHKRYERLCDLTAALTAATLVWVALSLATGHAYLNVVATVFAGATAAAWVALLGAQTPRQRAARRAFEKWREFESRWSACVALLELIEELPRSDHATVEKVLRETTADDELAEKTLAAMRHRLEAFALAAAKQRDEVAAEAAERERKKNDVDAALLASMAVLKEVENRLALARAEADAMEVRRREAALSNARAVAWSERYPPPGALGHLATRDPTMVRIADEAEKNALDGVVYESPAAAVTLKDATRWSAYAKSSGITEELLALFEPGTRGDRPVAPHAAVEAEGADAEKKAPH